MGQNDVIIMTKNFITAFYDLGITDDILAHMDKNIIGFGTQSGQYAVGSDAVESLLYRELAMVSPCKIVKLRLRDSKPQPGEQTVSATVVLRTSRENNVVTMYRILFMYHLRDDLSPLLQGIHIVKDTRHAATYRLVSSSMLNRRMEAQLEQEGSVRVVPSYTGCASFACLMDGSRAFSFFSDELWEMLGYTSRQAFDKLAAGGLEAMLPVNERSAARNALSMQLMRHDSYQLEYHLPRLDGTRIWVMECGRRGLSAEGKVVTQGVILDITPLREASESFLYHESYDELTKLYNKRAFCQKAQENIRLHPEKKFEIMHMDIERFKIINDLFGEESGDELLKYLAKFFLNLDLPYTVFGRMHSDHFLLCYPAEHENRQRFVHSLCALAGSYVLDYNVVPRFGVYCVQDTNLSVSSMCDRAGLALNRAKHSGLMVCAEYDEDMRQSIVNEQEIVNDMTDALANGEFFIYIQPKYEPVAEKIVGGEALVRWMHPVRGCISPAEFIPIFEHNGFIFQLDQYVWKETCKLLRKWMDEGKTPMPISVNVSRVDLYNAGLVDVLHGLIETYKIPAHLLELEVTESAYVDNPQRLIEVTKRLQSLGFMILMDDFGSGYSSLNMLKDMPVDLLKIDLKFLDSRDQSGRGGNILNSIVRMAKWLKIPVIAEGVETRQQAEFLRTLGCNCVQGYYYSKPISVQEYEQLIMMNACIPSSGKRPWLDAMDTEELLNPNAQFNIIFNSMNGGIGIYEYVDHRLDILRVNDGYYEMFEEDRNNFYMQDRQVIERLHKDDQEAFLAVLEEAGKEGGVTQCRVRRLCRNGKYIWLHVRISVIASDGERRLFYLAMENINELQEKSIEMQSLFDHLPCGFGICRLTDDRLQIKFMSRWMYEINEISPEDFSRETGGDLGRLLKDARLEAWLKKKVVQAHEKQRTERIKYTFKTWTGKEKQLQVLFNTVRDESGDYLCYFLLQDMKELQAFRGH